MGSLPNLHELCKQQPEPAAVPPRLSPHPDRGGAVANSAGGQGGRSHHRRLQQTNSLCTGNFYGVIDRQADVQINEVTSSTWHSGKVVLITGIVNDYD